MAGVVNFKMAGTTSAPVQNLNYVCNNGQAIGDANNDKTISSTDATIVNQIYAGITSAPVKTCCGDVNQDGKIGGTDASLILRYVASNTPVSFGTCCTNNDGCGSTTPICSNGRCTKCADSDFGSTTVPYGDPYIKGVTTGFMNGTVTSTSDFCNMNSTNRLTEFYCSNNQVSSMLMTCANGCNNGACLRTKSFPIITTSPLPDNLLANNKVSTIAKFDISAVNGDIYWRRINLNYLFSNTSTVLSNCLLIEDVDRIVSTTIQMKNRNISIDLSSEQEIIKSNKKSYSINCFISGMVGSGDTMQNQINGFSSSVISPTTYSNLIKTGETMFIWSDHSALNHNLTSSDWFGSKILVGQSLPSGYWFLFRQ